MYLKFPKQIAGPRDRLIADCHQVGGNDGGVHAGRRELGRRHVCQALGTR